MSASDDAPTFDVATGANRYYVFEIGSRPELFDINAHGGERTPANFYATWNDRDAPARLTAATYTLSAAAWERLRSAPKLYYRIGTTSSATGWDDYTVSTGDFEGSSAPAIEIASADDGGTSTGAPSVSGPQSLSSGDDPPVFDVTTGANPYYIFEITADPSLFDGANDGHRTDGTFYATWRDTSAPDRLTGPSYTLPMAAWNSLNASETLYYRIGTTSSRTAWDDYTVSTRDDQGADAPSMAISQDRHMERSLPPRRPRTVKAPPPRAYA
jgi:hypothetical protein